MTGVRILLLNDIFLSLNSANSLKTFRKNSIVILFSLTDETIIVLILQPRNMLLVNIATDM